MAKHRENSLEWRKVFECTWEGMYLGRKAARVWKRNRWRWEVFPAEGVDPGSGASANVHEAKRAAQDCLKPKERDDATVA